MIRFRIRNLELFDSRLEKAWRRRYDAVCDYLVEMDDDALLRALHDRRKRIEKSQEWLKRLEVEIEALARKTLKSPSRRRRLDPSSRTIKPATDPDGGRRKRAG